VENLSAEGLQKAEENENKCQRDEKKAKSFKNCDASDVDIGENTSTSSKMSENLSGIDEDIGSRLVLRYLAAEKYKECIKVLDTNVSLRVC